MSKVKMTNLQAAIEYVSIVYTVSEKMHWWNYVFVWIDGITLKKVWKTQRKVIQKFEKNRQLKSFTNSVRYFWCGQGINNVKPHNKHFIELQTHVGIFSVLCCSTDIRFYWTPWWMYLCLVASISLGQSHDLLNSVSTIIIRQYATHPEI